jgi:hypothetical protein
VNNAFTINLFPNPAGKLLNVWVEGVGKTQYFKTYSGFLFGECE